MDLTEGFERKRYSRQRFNGQQEVFDTKAPVCKDLTVSRKALIIKLQFCQDLQVSRKL
jgi:hypothetical protein